MTFNHLVDLIMKISPWSVVKIFILILLLLYVIFAAVLYRQVNLMNQILEAKFSPLLRLIALIHLLAIITILLIALVIL